MRQILFFLLIISSLSALPLPLDSVVTLPESSALLLLEGDGQYAVNDSGATLTSRSSTVWVRGENESLHLILPAGIATVNGTALVTISGDTAHFQVYRGYLRFTAAGGFPGETVPAGYERTVTRVKAEKPRSLISPDRWKLFCKKDPDRGRLLGCPGPKPVFSQPIDTTPEPEIDILLLIHSASATQDLQPLIDSIAPHKHLAETIERSDREGIETRIGSRSFPETLTLSRENRAYMIIDMQVEPHLNNPQKLFITVSLFDGRTNTVKKKRFPVSIGQTVHIRNGSHVSSFPDDFYRDVRKFIFLNI